ncbi:heat-stable enterotoxin receptor-like, partial [Trematomus bernacchii]|uniref:heat-stable enterotoxin receptor-like n=1 Tax=Trematomus bernacchii TaxID=40690 RepID=UPI00146AAFAC
MGTCWFWLCLCVLGFVAAQCRGRCLNGIAINVILLEDEESPWSLRFVRGQIEKAIETDSSINAAEDATFNLTANYGGFNTTIYRHKGCRSSACEGVDELKTLLSSGTLGCAVIGPTCTYATFQMVDVEQGLRLSTPIISAGSFGLTCDYTLNLQRILPPARKISSFFINFWEYTNKLKPIWTTTYIYKKPSNSEDCFWYINALDTDTSDFAKKYQKTSVRKPEELDTVLTASNRSSNLFIMCGSPKDVEEVKRVSQADSKDILFVLIDLFNDQYYINTSSLPSMKNVLVVTMPNTRNYVINTDLTDNNTMNDYMAAYHDSVLMIGEVMREIIEKNQSNNQQMEFVDVTKFRNTSFNGSAGTYKLDKHGDRDVNLSVIYTTNDNKYRVLFEFDTELQVTKVIDANPSFIWGKKLPDSTPDQDLSFPDIIVIVLAVTVVVVATIAFIFYRQNRRDRLVRKRWSHISSDLVTQLENNELNVVSLKIDDERKKMKFQIRRAHYDKK